MCNYSVTCSFCPSGISQFSDYSCPQTKAGTATKTTSRPTRLADKTGETCSHPCPGNEDKTQGKADDNAGRFRILHGVWCPNVTIPNSCDITHCPVRPVLSSQEDPWESGKRSDKVAYSRHDRFVTWSCFSGASSLYTDDQSELQNLCCTHRPCY